MASPAAERPAVSAPAPKGDGAARAARKAKREQGRWVREVKGILALALSGFGFVALYAFDPTLHLLDQTSPVGPVGVWLGWVFFWAFGYAGYLFPLLLAGYGASAFIRSRMVTGWPAAAGLGAPPGQRDGHPHAHVATRSPDSASTRAACSAGPCRKLCASPSAAWARGSSSSPSFRSPCCSSRACRST